MQRSQVNKILEDQVKRKSKIISYICIIVVLSFVALSFLLLFIKNNKPTYVKYTEDSNLNYNVTYKDNTFFENNNISANKQYIASLIEHIDAKFDYKLNLDKSDINYQYSYKIVAEVLVKDRKNNNVIFETQDVLLEEITKHTYNGNDTHIQEQITIDYNKYNNLTKSFVNTFSLDDVISTLEVKMYITTLGDCDDIETNNKDSVIALSIPLTEETMAIDMNYKLTDSSLEKLMSCDDTPKYNFIFLVISIVFVIISLILLYMMIKYILDTRTAESIYRKELKKILYNYKSYIQKVTKPIDLRGYQKIDIDTFTDLLEIRDTIRQPILMAENENKKAVYFVIPTNNKIIYAFALRAKDIQVKLEEKYEEEW